MPVFSFVLCLLVVSSALADATTLAYQGPNAQDQLEIEGVYFAIGPDLEIGGEVRKIELYITILRGIGRQDLSLTIAGKELGNIFYFASRVGYNPQERSDIIDINSYGVSMNGARQNLFFQVDTKKQIVSGDVYSSIFETEEPIFVRGEKLISISDKLAESRQRNCGQPEDYLGVYEGTMADGESTKLIIQSLRTSDTETTLTANLIRGVRILYHDGIYDPGVQMFIFKKDFGYSFRGIARKLMLLCDQDEDYWILRGINIATNGGILSNMEFRKKKNAK